MNNLTNHIASLYLRDGLCIVQVESVVGFIHAWRRFKISVLTEVAAGEGYEFTCPLVDNLARKERILF